MRQPPYGWGLNMRRFSVAALCCVFVSGCAVNPGDPTGFISALTPITGAIQTAAAMDQQLAEEFVRQSNQLEFLSRNRETCRDNREMIVPAEVKPKAIQIQEERRLYARLREVELLQEYAKALQAIAKGAADRDERFANIQRLINGARGAVSNVALTPLERQDVSVIADSATVILAALRAIDRHRTGEAIRREAARMEPKIGKMVASLKKRIHLVGVRTQAYLNAWRVCADEKYAFIRDKSVRNVQPALIVDLDNSYGAFQAQYRAFLNNVPQVDKRALDAIKDAHRKLMETDLAEFATTVEELNVTVSRLIDVYNNFNALPQKLANGPQ